MVWYVLKVSEIWPAEIMLCAIPYCIDLDHADHADALCLLRVLTLVFMRLTATFIAQLVCNVLQNSASLYYLLPSQY